MYSKSLNSKYFHFLVSVTSLPPTIFLTCFSSSWIRMMLRQPTASREPCVRAAYEMTSGITSIPSKGCVTSLSGMIANLRTAPSPSEGTTIEPLP